MQESSFYSDGIRTTLGEIESEIKGNLDAISDSLNATVTKKEPEPQRKEVGN